MEDLKNCRLMIDKLMNDISDLTMREYNFINELSGRLDNKRHLTRSQINRLIEIHQDYMNRREM